MNKPDSQPENSSGTNSDATNLPGDPDGEPSFGGTLRALQTQEELAHLLYVSKTAVSKWESGRGYPGSAFCGRSRVLWHEY